MQTSCAPSPSTRKHAAEGQLDLCLPQRVACEVWYHRNARRNQKSTLRWPMHARGPAGECRCDGRHGCAGGCRGVWEISRTVHARRPAWTCGPRAGARTGACTAVGRGVHARRSTGAYGCERTSNHGRSNRCEHSSRFGMRAATAKRQPSRINARASRPRPPRAGPRPTGRARRARRT